MAPDFRLDAGAPKVKKADFTEKNSEFLWEELIFVELNEIVTGC